MRPGRGRRWVAGLQCLWLACLAQHTGLLCSAAPAASPAPAAAGKTRPLTRASAAVVAAKAALNGSASSSSSVAAAMPVTPAPGSLVRGPAPKPAAAAAEAGGAQPPLAPAGQPPASIQPGGKLGAATSATLKPDPAAPSPRPPAASPRTAGAVGKTRPLTPASAAVAAAKPSLNATAAASAPAAGESLVLVVVEAPAGAVTLGAPPAAAEAGAKPASTAGSSKAPAQPAAKANTTAAAGGSKPAAAAKPSAKPSAPGTLGRPPNATLAADAAPPAKPTGKPAAVTPVPAKPASAGPDAPAAGDAPAAAGGNTTAAIGPRHGTVPRSQRHYKPMFPFPQCVNVTLTYDVSFVGPLLYMQVGSVRVAYHRFGPLNAMNEAGIAAGLSRSLKGNLSAVLFISGWGTSMYIWPIPLLRTLAMTREVVIFDHMRTQLSTDDGRERLTIPLMANNTAALIDALGLKQPDIWSWSIGADVGYALLAQHAAKIGNVILASGSPGGPDGLLAPREVMGGVARVQQNYTALLPYLFPDGADDSGVCAFYAAYNSFNSLSGMLATPLGKGALKEQGEALLHFFNDSSTIDNLRGVPNRVLILHGVEDRLCPVRNAALGASRLVGSWMLQFPGEGHGVLFSYLRGIIALTEEFFTFASTQTSAQVEEWGSYGLTLAQAAPRARPEAEAAGAAAAWRRP